MFKNIQNSSDLESVQVCRLCLAEEEDLIHILNPKGYQGFLLWEIIEELIQMEVSKKDGLPWTICEGCISKVTEFKHFKTKCIKSKISLLIVTANRGLVSSLVPSSPTWPLPETTEDFRKRPSSPTSREDSDEVEVVVIEESPVVSEDEDPLQSVTVVRREEGHVAKLSFAHGPLSPPSRETTKDIQNVPSSQLDGKDSVQVEVMELVEEESPITSPDEDPLKEVTVSRRERERRRGGKSCLAPRSPSQPSREPTKTILKRISSQTSRKDYDEVEVVEIVKEETPGLSADEDYPREVTVSRRERDRGHKEKINVKDEIDTGKLLSDAETCGKQKLFRDESTCMGVSRDATLSDPLDLNGVKKDDDAMNSMIEAMTYNQENVQDVESLEHVGACNVVCLPLEMGECSTDDEDVARRESQVKEVTHEGDNPVEDYSLVTPVTNLVSVPQSVVDMVYGCSMTDESPKICERIVTDLRDDRKKNITKKFEGNTSLSGLPEEHSLRNMKNFSAKKEESIKLGDCNTGALKFSDTIPPKIRHLNSHKKPLRGCTAFICDHCGVKYTDKKKLVVHVRGHILSKRASTSLMDENYSLNRSESSITEIQSSKPFKCEMCGKKFKFKIILRKHYVVHRDLRPFKCETCGNGYKCKSHLIRHVAIHSNLMQLKCEICGKEYKKKYYLLKHSKIHLDLKPFKCETCGQNFERKNNLLDHCKMHLDMKPFKCENCGKGFKCKNDLKRHVIIHSNLKPFKCITCGKGFRRKLDLTKHLAIHSNLRPFNCEICGKAFKVKNDFCKHLVIHSGLRPFKCDTCGKGFVRKYHLKIHMVIHSDLRPFKCDTCGKKFAKKKRLVAHSVIHSGLRPYKCDTCGKRFFHKISLVRHTKMHSGLCPFKCDTCGKEFSWRANLSRHSIKHR